MCCFGEKLLHPYANEGVGHGGQILRDVFVGRLSLTRQRRPHRHQVRPAETSAGQRPEQLLCAGIIVAAQDAVGVIRAGHPADGEIVKVDHSGIDVRGVLPDRREEANELAHTVIPPVFVPGQECLIQLSVLGFELDKAKMQPSVTVEMRALDSTDKATLSQPITERANIVPVGGAAIPMQFLLKLNRSGKFTVELKATDDVSKKTTARRSRSR